MTYNFCLYIFLFYFMCVGGLSSHLCLCTVFISYDPGGQKLMLDALKLELQIGSSYQVRVKNKNLPLENQPKLLNTNIFLVSKLYLSLFLYHLLKPLSTCTFKTRIYPVLLLCYPKTLIFLQGKM